MIGQVKVMATKLHEYGYDYKGALLGTLGSRPIVTRIAPNTDEPVTEPVAKPVSELEPELPFWWTNNPIDLNTDGTLSPAQLLAALLRTAQDVSRCKYSPGGVLPEHVFAPSTARFLMDSFCRAPLCDLLQFEHLPNYGRVSFVTMVSPGCELTLGEGHMFKNAAEMSWFLNSRDQSDSEAYSIAYTASEGWYWKAYGSVCGSIRERGARYQRIFGYYSVHPILAADGVTVVGFTQTVEVKLEELYLKFVPSDAVDAVMRRVVRNSYAPHITVAAACSESTNFAQMGYQLTPGSKALAVDCDIMRFEPFAVAAAQFCKCMEKAMSEPFGRDLYRRALPLRLPADREGWRPLFPATSAMLKALPPKS